jgi:hypothetical protein
MNLHAPNSIYASKSVYALNSIYAPNNIQTIRSAREDMSAAKKTKNSMGVTDTPRTLTILSGT